MHDSLMLFAQGLAKQFPAAPAPVHALRGVDLSVPHGSFTAILGPSGCGKTTLLRIIAGIERPDRGELVVAGRLLDGGSTHVPPERRGMGLVPQEGVLFPHLDVAGNVGFGLRRTLGAPLSARARRARVDELLELVGLPGYGTRRPHELSGGQQQRVAVARALASQPTMVLLDEPFSALDAGMRAELRQEIRDLLRETGSTTVLVTHDQEEALSLADQVAVMRDGRIAQCGSPRVIYDSPADLDIASFVGDAVFLPAVIERNGARVAHSVLGSIAVRSANGETLRGPCTLLIRPEHLRLDSSGAPARVTDVAFYGHDGVLRLRLGDDGAGAAVAARIVAGEAPEVGALVHVRVNGDAVAYGGAVP